MYVPERAGSRDGGQGSSRVGLTLNLKESVLGNLGGVRTILFREPIFIDIIHWFPIFPYRFEDPQINSARYSVSEISAHLPTSNPFDSKNSGVSLSFVKSEFIPTHTLSTHPSSTPTTSLPFPGPDV